MVVIVTLDVSVIPERRTELMDLFASYAGPASAQPGCLAVRLYSPPASSVDFLLLEEWNSAESLEKHVQSDDFRKVLAIMDLAGEPPELRFNTISSVDGFELVEKLRERKSYTVA
jgi:quinol monooxygenase YgiN